MSNEGDRLKILFLCTGNSCRSQMAEGWVRALKPDKLDANSAGVASKYLDPRAVTVMRETGVDISSQRSKDVSALSGVDFDFVVTVCDNARESCPVFPGQTKVIHVGFEDPPQLARTAKYEDEALGHYRRIRDEIRAFVETLPESIVGKEEV